MNAPLLPSAKTPADDPTMQPLRPPDGMNPEYWKSLDDELRQQIIDEIERRTRERERQAAVTAAARKRARKSQRAARRVTRKNN